jgi:putative endonuclease
MKSIVGANFNLDMDQKVTTLPEWYVYFLRSLARPFLYVGSTDNLQKRLEQHNDGEVQSTKAYRPLMIAGYVAVETERKARELERYFKTGSGKAILRKQILTDEVPTWGT